MYCAYLGKEKIIMLLLEKGANFHIIESTGKNALQISKKGENKGVYEKALKKFLKKRHNCSLLFVFFFLLFFQQTSSFVFELFSGFSVVENGS